MDEVTALQLKRMIAEGQTFQLIDVREPYEAEICSIGGTLIPLGEVLERMTEIRTDIPVVVHCKSGGRSAAVIQALTERYGYTNLINLKGGITAYSAEADPAIRCE